MKSNIPLLVLLTGLTMASAAREFKSADDSQIIRGEFIRYNVKDEKVTIRIGSGNNLVASANKFSAEDVQYFIEQQKAEDKRTAISVNTDKKSERDSGKRGNMLYKYKESTVSFTVKNSGDFPFSGLKLKYWMAVERDNKGKQSTELLTGSKEISHLNANSEVSVEGPTVRLVQGAVSKCKTGCPKVAAAAAKVGDEHIIGTKVEITNEAGEVLFRDDGPSRLKTLIDKKK